MSQRICWRAAGDYMAGITIARPARSRTHTHGSTRLELHGMTFIQFDWGTLNGADTGPGEVA